MLSAIIRFIRNKKSISKGSDRRLSPRIMQTAPCTVYDHIRLQTRKQSMVRDVGFFGICIDTDFPVSLADEFTLGFSIGETNFDQVKAFVVWTGQYGMNYRSGLAFESPVAPKVQKAIVKLFKNIGT
ncbi:MAG: hypothetical protein HY400_04375 [Elusimicrobia bacterium]|nr:hypothetical protein [Elusimicrobiota bacterium]